MSISQNFPTDLPTLNLDFVNNQFLDPRITFTRTSSATYFNSSGVLTTAANNVPRFDYDPVTFVPRGFLIEEQRTNSIRNNTMQGAVAGTPGTLPTNWSLATALTGLTQQIIGTGTENGIEYIEIKLSGTPSGAGTYRYYYEGTTAVAALTAQTWANSQYMKLAGGTLTGVSSFTDIYQEFTSGGVYITEGGVTTSTPTTAALRTQRSTTTRTLAGGATTAFVRSGIQLQLSGVAIDITLRIGLPQLEQGAFATSVIPTTTTALTRNADVASMTGTNFSSWFNASEGAMVVQASGINNTAASLFAMDDGTTSERIINIFNGATTQIAFRVVDGGADQANFAAGNITALSQFKLASAYKVNDFAAVVNNGTVQTDISGTLPTVTTARIGCNVVSGAQINGYIQRISYYPVRLTNAQLQALTR